MTPKLNAIGLVVADMDSAIKFYGRLGLAFPQDPATYEDGHTFVELPGGVKVMLDTEASIRSLYPGWSRATGGHSMALAFEFDTPAEVDAKFGELAAAGYQPLREPWDAPWGQRYAAILDPDGNSVDLYCALPRT